MSPEAGILVGFAVPIIAVFVVIEMLRQKEPMRHHEGNQHGEQQGLGDSGANGESDQADAARGEHHGWEEWSEAEETAGRAVADSSVHDNQEASDRPVGGAGARDTRSTSSSTPIQRLLEWWRGTPLLARYGGSILVIVLWGGCRGYLKSRPPPAAAPGITQGSWVSRYRVVGSDKWQTGGRVNEVDGRRALVGPRWVDFSMVVDYEMGGR